MTLTWLGSGSSAYGIARRLRNALRTDEDNTLFHTCADTDEVHAE